MLRPINHSAKSRSPTELGTQTFRGRTLTHSSTGQALPGTYDDWGLVLATSPTGLVWMARADGQFVAAAWPEELGSGATLREQLTVERFMGLLPLAHFLRELSAAALWEQPESKACFVFDDPNLHWWSYGYLDYRELAAHAEAHDYRVTAATIPLDQWYIHRPTARFLREGASRISFAIHGNNHTRHELGRVDDPDRASTLAAEALKRARAVHRPERRLVPSWFPDTRVLGRDPRGVSACRVRRGLRRMALLVASRRRRDLGAFRLVPLDRPEGLPVIPRLTSSRAIGTTCPSAHSSASHCSLCPPHGSEGRPRPTRRSRRRCPSSRRQFVAVAGQYCHGRLLRLSVRGEHGVHAALAETRIPVPEGVSEARLVWVGREPSETTLRPELRDAGGLREIAHGEVVVVDAGKIP